MIAHRKWTWLAVWTVVLFPLLNGQSCPTQPGDPPGDDTQQTECPAGQAVFGSGECLDCPTSTGGCGDNEYLTNGGDCLPLPAACPRLLAPCPGDQVRFSNGNCFDCPTTTGGCGNDEYLTVGGDCLPLPEDCPRLLAACPDGEAHFGTEDCYACPTSTGGCGDNEYRTVGGECLSLPAECPRLTADLDPIAISLAVTPAGQVGFNESFTVTATVTGGRTPYTYQWFKEGSEAGSSGTSFTTSADVSPSLTILVRVQDADGTVAEESVTVFTTSECGIACPTVEGWWELSTHGPLDLYINGDNVEGFYAIGFQCAYLTGRIIMGDSVCPECTIIEGTWDETDYWQYVINGELPYCTPPVDDAVTHNPEDAPPLNQRSGGFRWRFNGSNCRFDGTRNYDDINRLPDEWNGEHGGCAP